LTHRGVGTSIAAAAAFAPKLPTHQAAIEGAVGRAGPHGAISDEVAEELGEGWNVHKVRFRMSELRNLGKVVDSGKRRKSKCGVLATVIDLPRYAEGEADAQ
jgi:hypothetical protein